MRRALLIVFLFSAPAAAQTPKLAVLIVVDQFPARNLERMPKGGKLESIIRSAAVFPTGLQDHVPTETAPGHASISTGRPPSVHGITGNEIFDRATGKASASIDDPVNGASAWRLNAPALADAFRKKYPRSRIVSVSVKDRAAILLAGKSPSVVLWFSHSHHGFVTSRAYGALPAWVAAVNDSISWLNGDIQSPFSKLDWSASPSSDRAVLAAARAAITAEHLGQHESPDLLLVSFSATDAIGHKWGPDSKQMAVQLQELDQRLGELAESAEAAAPGKTIFALTSDHGVLPVPESDEGRRLNARRVNPNDFQGRIERRLQAARPRSDRSWILRIDVPDVFLAPGSGESAKERETWIREAAGIISSEPEVAAVYIPGQSQPADDFSEIFRRSYFPGRSGDLQVRIKSGILLTPWPTGTTHGTPYDYDAAVPILFWGAGIHPGRNPERVSVESIAPTIATIMKVDLAPANGRVLTEALQP